MSQIEQVGVIPRKVAASLNLLEQGFHPLKGTDVLDAIINALSFMERPAAEEDPSFKQIIPYGAVLKRDEVLVLQRLSGGGEKRLHGKISLGVGGHLNPVDETQVNLSQQPDLSRGDVISATMYRELTEELYVHGLSTIEPIGYINDDTTTVGQVHLGIVYRIDLTHEGAAKVREIEVLTGGFQSWNNVAKLRDRMESWSVFLMDAYERGGLL
jgi:predicted NUDIX family phosphoesterase